jgi:hypothetical protein
MIEVKLDKHSQKLRDYLLQHADPGKAMELATAISDQVNDTLNDQGVTSADSLLARALLANAILRVAGTWYADLMKCPPPPAVEAI